jgi:hypothetical protein
MITLKPWEDLQIGDIKICLTKESGRDLDCRTRLVIMAPKNIKITRVRKREAEQSMGSGIQKSNP